MTLPANLPNYFHKIEWAGQKLQELDLAVAAWFDGNKHSSHRVEPDPDDPTKSLLKVRAEDIPVSPFSLLIGDIVQNIRSSLDHVAYSLAVAHTKPLSEQQAAESQFPIHGDVSKAGIPGQGPVKFANSLTREIACIEPRAQALIEAVQPYKEAGNFRKHPLWMLRELSNIDKHRTLHVGAAATGTLTFSNLAFDGVPEFVSGVIKNETVVARLGVVRSKDPGKTVEMNIVPTMSIAFADGPLESKQVIPLLGWINQFVCNHVVNPLTRFL